MKTTDLPTSGAMSNGIALRTELAKAISGLQIVAARSGTGKAPGATQLAVCLTAALAAVNALKPA